MTAAGTLRTTPAARRNTRRSRSLVPSEPEATPNAADINCLLTTQQAAAYTPYTAHGLENLRSAGRGPAFIKIHSGAVAYRLADLLAWQDQHRISTIDQD